MYTSLPYIGVLSYAYAWLLLEVLHAFLAGCLV